MHLDFDFRPGEGLPYSALGRLRDAGPVVWSENLGGWLVTSWAAVREVLGDVGRFTSAGTPVAEVFGGQGMLVDDTPMHHVLRAVWAKRVTPVAMQARMAELDDNARRVLAPPAERMKAGEVVDFIPVFRDFVMEFIALSFGVSRAHLDIFENWSKMSADTPALGLEQGSEAQERHNRARADVVALVAGEMEDRRQRLDRGEDPADLIAPMVAAVGEKGITRQMAADNLFNFILGAMDTTEKWIGNIVLHLAADPAMRARVAANYSLIAALADEVMRFDTVAQTIQRRVREPGTRLAGRDLKGGDTIYLMLGAANRDETEYTGADSFVLDRPPSANLGFGFGFHHCLGINIARAEVVAFIGVLLDTLGPLRIAGCDHGDSWALWGPRRLELALAD
ncbi:MAG: cytochrome P450 [Novosphingobium sp.]